MNVRYTFAPVLAVWWLAACSSETAAGGTRTSAASEATPEAAPANDASEGGVCGAPLFALCSDGQIAAILAAESQAHLDLANAVRPRLTSSIALEFAEKIVTDDAVLQVQVSGELRETSTAAAPGGIDREIAAEARGDIQALDAETGAALDASYLDREALAHLRALGLIDHLLYPSVHDPRIGDLLARVRGVVVAHAQAVVLAQVQLEGSCGSIVAR